MITLLFHFRGDACDLDDLAAATAREGGMQVLMSMTQIARTNQSPCWVLRHNSWF